MEITKNITIEELVDILPEAVQYLMKEGIKCIACGEPIWGTLEEAAVDKKFSSENIERFVRELNELMQNKTDKIEGIKIEVSKLKDI